MKIVGENNLAMAFDTVAEKRVIERFSERRGGLQMPTMPAGPISCSDNHMSNGRIEQDPDVVVGKPLIRGARITVELILRHVAEGMSFTSIVDAYPRLTIDDVKAAIGYAADDSSHQRMIAA